MRQSIPATSRRERITRFRYWLDNFLSIFLTKDLHLKLQSSNWQITVSEYVLIQLSGAVIGLLLGWTLGKSVVIGVIAGIILYMLPSLILQHSIFVRQRKFQNQLVDVLVLIRGAVQAGFSLLQSLNVVVQEMPAPVGEEFSRVQREVQFGIPLSQALESLADRMESNDLDMVVTAIIINNQVGGNLSLMLTAVTETIRNRIALLGEVRALTSYARYTSYLLTLLPFVTTLIIILLSPNYFAEALDFPLTRLIFVLAFISVLIGNIWLRRIAHIRL